MHEIKGEISYLSTYFDDYLFSFLYILFASLIFCFLFTYLAIILLSYFLILITVSYYTYPHISRHANQKQPILNVKWAVFG